MSNDAPKMKKYIVEAPEPGPGEVLSSGGIRKDGKMTYKNARPYEEPTSVVVQQPRRPVPASQVKAKNNSMWVDLGKMALGMIWDEVGRPVTEAWLHDMGQKAVNAIVSKTEPNQRPTVIDVEPEDIVVVSEEDNVVQFQPGKRSTNFKANFQ